MKKTLSKILIAVAIIFTFVPAISAVSVDYVYAYDPDASQNSSGTTTTNAKLGNIQLNNPLGNNGPSDLKGLLDKISSFMFAVTIALAPIFYLYSGWQLVTSGGDPKKTQTGWNTIKFTTIGVAVALLANAIVKLIANFLGA